MENGDKHSDSVIVFICELTDIERTYPLMCAHMVNKYNAQEPRENMTSNFKTASITTMSSKELC